MGKAQNAQCELECTKYNYILKAQARTPSLLYENHVFLDTLYCLRDQRINIFNDTS